jgi:DNA-binding winged helix-turn-helix (wHTH) protein/TolB-like protein
MQPQAKIYRFDNFTLDVTNRELLRDGESISLPAKAFDMLVALVEKAGQLVGKEELFDRVWPDQVVEESNLTVQISAIRKALGERTNNPKYLITVPGHGYRFIGRLLQVEEEQEEVLIEHHAIAQFEIAGSTTDSRQGELRQLSEGPSSRKWLVVLIGMTMLVVVGLGLYRFTRSEVTTHASIRKIAVLPFKPVVSTNRDESLELGMADTLITRLGGLKDLKVRPTSAVRKYTELEQDAVDAGREQEVDAVLDGSIQRVGERIRVTVRLVNVADGRQLWADKFDEKSSDLFGVQDSIASRVVSILALTLGRDENQQLQKRYTNNQAAYEAYLKGRYHWNKETPEGYKKSIEHFQEAISLDPNYALAYAGIADSHNMMGYWGVVPPREAFPQAKEAANKSLAIDESLGEAHSALAYAQYEYDWDVSKAETNYKRAIELNPGYASAHQWYAEYLLISGRFEEAAVEMKRARDIDPLSSPINFMSAALFYEKRNYDDAIVQLQRVLELDPNFEVAYGLAAICYSRKGMHEEAVTSLQRQLTLSGEDQQAVASLSEALRKAGMNGYWLRHIELLKDRSTRTYISPIYIALDYAEIGDAEKAFEWLEKAYSDKSGWLLELKIDPTWDKFRGDARFKSLVYRIEHPDGN